MAGEEGKNDQKCDGLTSTGISQIIKVPLELNKSFYRNVRFSNTSDGVTCFFLLHQKSQRKEQPILHLTEEETSRLVELVSRRERTAPEILVHGRGMKDGIDTLIGNWNKSRAALISGEDSASLKAKIAGLEADAEDLFKCSPEVNEKLAKLKKELAEQPANPRLQEQLDSIQLRGRISDATYGSEWILKGIAARNPYCKKFVFKPTDTSLSVSGPGFLANISVVQATIDSTQTVTVRYDSVQNGWSFRIPALPVSESSIYLIFERLAHSLLNHVPMHQLR